MAGAGLISRNNSRSTSFFSITASGLAAASGLRCAAWSDSLTRSGTVLAVADESSLGTLPVVAKVFLDMLASVACAGATLLIDSSSIAVSPLTSSDSGKAPGIWCAGSCDSGTRSGTALFDAE